MASIFFLSIAFAPLINLSMFKCLGGSSSAIIVTFCLTLSTIVGLLLESFINSSSAGRGVINLRLTGASPLIPFL